MRMRMIQAHLVISLAAFSHYTHTMFTKFYASQYINMWNDDYNWKKYEKKGKKKQQKKNSVHRNEILEDKEVRQWMMLMNVVGGF